MSSALEKWDQLVSRTIIPEHTSLFVTEEPFNLLVLQSSDLAAQIKKQLRKQVFTFPSEKGIELFVQQHQSVLIRLLDKIEGYKESKAINTEQKRLYHCIEEQLGTVLNFIEHYFPKYFNLDEAVPIPYFKVVHKELCTQFESCRRLLQKHKEKDGELTEMLCGFLSDFCSRWDIPVSYRSLIYYKELFSQVLRLSDSQANGYYYSPLMELLLYLNFNCTSFVSYCTEKIEKEVKAQPDVNLKLETLARHQKQLGQLQVKPAFALHRDLPFARDQVISSLSKEMDYLKAITPALQHSAVVSPAELPVYKELVHIPFRAPEIYLFCKAFVDAGGAPTETYTSLLEKTGPHLSNKKQKGFSPESLIKASDKVNPESRDNVKRFLQRMMRNLESYD